MLTVVEEEDEEESMHMPTFGIPTEQDDIDEFD